MEKRISKCPSQIYLFLYLFYSILEMPPNILLLSWTPQACLSPQTLLPQFFTNATIHFYFFGFILFPLRISNVIALGTKVEYSNFKD